MRVQNFSMNYQNQNVNFKAAKYVEGDISDLRTIAARLYEEAYRGVDEFTSRIGFRKPNFDMEMVPLDGDASKEGGESIAIIATEEQALPLHNLVNKAQEATVETGREFYNFIKKNIGKFLKIDSEEKDAREMLKEMEGSYDFANLSPIK